MAKPVLVLDLNETLVYKKNSTIVNRPGLEDFLSKMAMAYRIVIFSASDSKHVAQCMAGFGASAELISDVYDIQDCTRTRSIFATFIKDVSKIRGNYDVKRLVWLDNNRFHYSLCPHNGIQIKAFKGDPEDRELGKLIPLLIKLSKVEDVTCLLSNGQPKEEGDNTLDL